MSARSEPAVHPLADGIVDDNAVVRQPYMQALLKQFRISILRVRASSHTDRLCEVDPDGEIGLITTGAGLSMQLIDELKAEGRRPINFCDIGRSIRADPARLIAVMRWIVVAAVRSRRAGQHFAGITDLPNSAASGCRLSAGPELRVPVMPRLIGRNLDEQSRSCGRPI